MLRLSMGLLLMLGLCLPAAGQDTNLVTFPLGPNGEIIPWLLLGYIPLAVEPNDNVLATDLLADAGSEAKTQPKAGDRDKLAASAVIGAPVDLGWRPARARQPIMSSAWAYSRCDRLFLFADDKGQPMSKAACYLYCQLISPTDMKLSLFVGVSDSIRVRFNGQVVHHNNSKGDGLGNLCHLDEILLPIKKGTNSLLVRLDNYLGYGGFAGYLADPHGAAPDSIRVQLALRPNVTAVPNVPPPPPQSWDKIVAEIPSVKPADHPEFLGAHLLRTMALLESGALTRRPVRIVFYGQSNESGWTDMLIQRLRERYPNTPIHAENHALGGWNVWRLVRAMKHDITRSQPDLVLFHAYNGTFDEWERFFQTLRKETCAEIVTRTSHIAGWDAKDMDTIVNYETTLLQGLARKYDVELVDARREWIEYLRANNLKHTDLIDQTLVHMNRKGQVLMVQLYERHFRLDEHSRGGWMNGVRYYSALRPLDERRVDEIALEGPGWRKAATEGPEWAKERLGATAQGAGNRLKLRFFGTRVDLVLLPSEGGARILIDGKPPSTFHLLHGERPFPTVGAMLPPGSIMQYFIGRNIRPETWELTFKDISPDAKTFRFALRGSLTGEDGEGCNTVTFVSKSGRITIAGDDWTPAGSWPPPKGWPQARLVWRIVGDYRDHVQCPPASPDRPPDGFEYVTVADGLPPGEHVLTLIPGATGDFSIHAIEAYNPPMAGK
jgi:hypothetical protein